MAEETTNDCPHFNKNLMKYTVSHQDRAFTFRKGYDAALSEILTSGDDAYWTTMQSRDDRNGNRSWYVDLHSCDQATFMSMECLSCSGTGRGGSNTTDGGQDDDCCSCSGEG